MPTYQIGKKNFLTPEEEAALRSSLNVPTRDVCLILLALETGARLSEIRFLKVSDIDLKTKSISITGLKNSYDREIPINNATSKLLGDFLRRVKLSESQCPFGVSIVRVWQIWQQFKPTDKKFHALRHTFGTNLYRKTRDLHLVQQAMGHKNIKNTMVYMHYVFGTEQLRKAMA